MHIQDVEGVYYSSADLSKHAKIHDNVEHRCSKCDYTNKDIRLLRSHQQKHDQIVHYYCTKCGTGFIYHIQWARHKEAADCVALNCSASPEH